MRDERCSLSAAVPQVLFIQFRDPEWRVNVTRIMTRSPLTIELYAALIGVVISEGRKPEGPRAKLLRSRLKL